MVGFQGHRHVIFVVQEIPLGLWNGSPRYDDGPRGLPAEQAIQIADVVRLRQHLLHGGGLYRDSSRPDRSTAGSSTERRQPSTSAGQTQAPRSRLRAAQASRVLLGTRNSAGTSR